MSRTVLVVPCYNEEDRFAPDAFAGFSKRHEDVDWIFVDDGSRDATPSLLAGLCERDPQRFSVTTLPRNAGKAEAVRRGMLAGAERSPRYLGYWDADLATPLEELVRFVALLDERPDLEGVLGARVKLLGHDVERQLWRHYPGRVFATVASRTLDLPVYDTQCGAKLFRCSPGLAAVFEAPFASNWAFDVELLARWIARRRDDGLPPLAEVLYEMPLMRWSERGRSKVGALDFPRGLLELARIRRRYGSGLR